MKNRKIQSAIPVLIRNHIKTSQMKNIISVIIFILFISCGEKTNKEEVNAPENTSTNSELIQITKEQFENSDMKLGAFSQQEFPEVIQITGMIDVPPQNKAIISSYMGGYVKNTPLLIGDKVKKGQVLITLENPSFIELQQNYLEIKQRLDFLQNEYSRQKTLVEEQISSQKNFLKAESEYKSALATSNGLKKKLQMLNINVQNVEAGNITSTVSIYSPIHGSVTKLNISKGKFVSPADEIMEIINTNHVHLELSVFEKDILNVKKGQRIIFSIPEATSNSFEAEVYLVGTSIDLNNRTVKVHGHIKEETEQHFAVGMFVDAQIITESKTSNALPNDAIITIDEKHYVLINKDNGWGGYSFEQKEVNIGGSANGFTQINGVNTFNPEDSFLIKGGFNLIGE